MRDLHNPTGKAKVYNWFEVLLDKCLAHNLWDNDHIGKLVAQDMAKQPEYCQLGRVFVNTSQVETIDGNVVYFKDGDSFHFDERRANLLKTRMAE